MSKSEAVKDYLLNLAPRLWRVPGKTQEVAEKTGASTRTVRRVRESLEKRQPSGGVTVGPRDFKRVLAIGDLHCGHYAGLTPPMWQTDYAPNAPLRFKVRSSLQREMWQHFTDTVDALGPIDILIVNGDAIDGKAKRNNGVELFTASTTEQAEIAAECIKYVKADEIHMTHGTGYHVTADGEECEDWIAREVGATIDDHAWLDINGCVFDIKHHLGSSSVPYGRATQLAKETVWNRLWEEIEGAPKGDIFIRSHVHYHMHVGDSSTYLAMTLPPLQGPMTKFGAQRCSGTVHFGLTHFDVPNDYNGNIQDIEWRAHTRRLRAAKPTVIQCGRA